MVLIDYSYLRKNQSGSSDVFTLNLDPLVAAVLAPVSILKFFDTNDRPAPFTLTSRKDPPYPSTKLSRSTGMGSLISSASTDFFPVSLTSNLLPQLGQTQEESLNFGHELW